MAEHASKGRVALITGITGQDGAYLAESCSASATPCTGSSAGRRRSTPRGSTISITTRMPATSPFLMHYGDMTDSTNLIAAGAEIRPTEIYNLAAQSHVAGQLREPGIHGQCRRHGHAAPARGDPHPRSMETETRFYQASTSELYGLVQETPQNETTPFYPRSPYGGRQALCLLDHGELPRGLWYVRQQRHPVQP
jgi:GDPmannose 4,6-dehydratase